MKETNPTKLNAFVSLDNFFLVQLDTSAGMTELNDDAIEKEVDKVAREILIKWLLDPLNEPIFLVEEYMEFTESEPPFNPGRYDVEVLRVEHSSRTVSLDLTKPVNPEDLAQQVAGDFVYTGSSVEYEVLSINRVGDTIHPDAESNYYLNDQNQWQKIDTQ